MGEKLDGNNQISNQTDSNGNGTKSANPSTGSATATGGRGRGGRGAAAGAGAAQPSQKVPKLVPVDVPGSETDKEEAKKAAARERQRKARAKKKAATSTKTSSPANGDQIKIMLITMSTIMASRPGMEMWALSPNEADQIVTPLSSIMAKSNVGESLGEYADHIALGIACFTILIPKFLAWQAAKPKKKEVQNPYVRSNQNTNGTRTNESGKAPVSSGTSDKQPTNTHANVGGFLSELIPASVGI